MAGEQTSEMATLVDAALDGATVAKLAPARDAALAVNAADLAELLDATHDALPLLDDGAERDRLEAAAARFQAGA